MPDDVDQVDISLAGLAKYAHRQRQSPEVTLVAYGQMNIVIDSRFTNTTALTTQKSQRRLLITRRLYTTSWTTKCRIILLALGYTFKGSRGTLEALYTVMIGDATLEVGGKTGLRDECTDTGHTGRPWAWLCSAKIQSRPKLFTLMITIPF